MKRDVLEVTGATQLCLGIEAGCEAAVHAMKIILENENTEAVLLVDAQNTFNLLNRRLALANIHQICPSMATILTNMYRANASLFIQDETVLSREGVMQGDPMAMAMFALGIAPLIEKLKGTHQVWYADDATAGGSLSQVHHWWTKLVEIGPLYGYHPNPTKTWLIVKEDYYDEAKTIFSLSGVNVNTTGRKHLGAALGRQELMHEYVETKVKEWTSEVEHLAEIARRDPHVAYAAITHGLKSKWQYIMRTVPNTSHLFAPLEDALRYKLIPVITGRSNLTDDERNLLSLPCRLHGRYGPDQPDGHRR